MADVLAGHRAEAAVADYLQNSGYKILDRNWKTAVCEIDIVAVRNSIVYFIEVKYRANPAQGSGLDYITPRKLKQMEFAARIWNQQHDWAGDWRLVAAAVGSKSADDVDFIETS